ncbi:uncharacterized protein EDB93DRAFT_1101798 [Suillus bovinus]|uniref:uncharacterized protein n=1 Tax=Suillus bovinus TaxID=48563 RepID=UPI001B872D11|nr:uncharacterized protein EDB93DRAFT_1101798 [Suillus bovinus]KAG2155219.1 hypothetical protein EDB93DRAFT_1101798 [Suillus bovinus]
MTLACRMVFRWIFILWLQQELDAYQDHVNNTAKQRDCNKILPHGVPNLIYDLSEDFGALDFKIKIEREALDHVRNIYIKPSHCVFDLVPEAFGRFTFSRGAQWHLLHGWCGWRIRPWFIVSNSDRLDSLTDNDEPNITLGIDEDLVGLDHAGLVVWEFSDCESEDEMVNE